MVAVAAPIAPSSANVLVYYSFDNADYSAPTLSDLTANSVDATNTGVTVGTVGVYEQSFTWSGAGGDYLSFTSPDLSGSYSINLWIDPNDLNDHNIQLYGSINGGNHQAMIDGKFNNHDKGFRVYHAGSYYFDTSTDQGFSTGTWDNMLTVVFDDVANTLKIYNNGILKETAASVTTNCLAIADFYIGVRGDLAGSYDGEIDEFMITSDVLTTDEMEYLYNLGSPSTAQQWDFTGSAASTGNHSLEINVLLEQQTPVQVNSNVYQLVSSGTFTPVNSSNATLAANIEVESSKALDMQCKVLVDSVDYDTELNRTFGSAAIGVMYITSTKFEVTGGVDVDLEMWCRRISTLGGTIKIDKGVNIVHLLVDSAGNEINNKFINNNLNITSSTYQLLANTTFTTGNLASSGLLRNLVFDGEITYNYDTTGTIRLYSVVNGETSPVFERYGTGGSTGNGGNFNILYNLTNATSIPVLIYGKSSTGDGDVDVKLTIKEFIGHTQEFNVSDLNETSLTSTTWATAKKVVINNSDHASGDLLVKATASTKSTSGDQEVVYRLYYNGSAYSPEFSRDIINAGAGVSILEYLFTDIGTGMFDVELQYKVESNAQITTGSLMAYLSGNIAPTSNDFEVTARNKWDNTSITSFNVTINGGGTFFESNASGIALVTALNPSNLTIRSANYLDLSVLNHNVSNDYLAELYQSIIWVNITEMFSGNPIGNWTLFNDTTVLINTTNSVDVFYPNAGEFNDLLLHSNTGAFSDRSLAGFNVSLFEQNTKYFQLLPTEFNVTAENVLTSASIDNFTITYSSLNNSHSGTFSTTTASIVFGVINGDTYNVTIDAEDFSLFNNFILKLVSGNTNHTFSLYTTNSIYFYFRYEHNESLIDQALEVEIIGDTYSYNHTVNNGTLYIDLISPDSYTIRTNSDGYLENFYYLNLASRSYNEVTIYLAPNTSSTIRGVVIDEVNNFLEGAIIRVLKYYSDDNSYKVVGMGKTNFEGETDLIVQKESEYYKFMIYYPAGTLKKTTNAMYIYEDTEQLTFQLVLGSPVAGDYLSAFFADYSFIFNDNTNNFRFTFSDVDGLSSQYCIEVYKVNALSALLLNTSCLTSSSGTILIGITPVNGSNYLAKAYAYYDNSPYFLDSVSVSFSLSNTNPLWLFLVIFLTIALAMSAIWNLQAFLLLTPLPLFLTSIIGLIPISPFITGSLYVGFIIIAFAINK